MINISTSSSMMPKTSRNSHIKSLVLSFSVVTTSSSYLPLANLPERNQQKRPRKRDKQWVKALPHLEKGTRKRIFAAVAADAVHTTCERKNALPVVSVKPAASGNSAGPGKTLPAPASLNLLLWAGRSAVDRRLGKHPSIMSDAPNWRRPRVQIPAGPPFHLSPQLTSIRKD